MLLKGKNVSSKIIWRILRNGLTFYDKANFVIPTINKQKLDFGLEFYQDLKSFYSEVIEEMESFAKDLKKSLMLK